MFDTHCHLDFDAFDHDRSAVVEQARAVGVRAIHIPGVERATWPRVAALCTGEVGLGFGIGLHPWFLSGDEELTDLATVAERSGAEAIGECGLDGNRAKQGGASLTVQTRIFEQHLAVAIELGLPVVIHIVGAHGLAVEVLERHGPLVAGGVLHSYSGSAELVSRYAALNLSFSFGGIITRDTARRPRAALVAVPDDRLLLESDGPDQPLRGASRSEPEDVAIVCAQAAAIRGMSPTALAALTTTNANRLFKRAR